jgi:hypothetical protein
MKNRECKSNPEERVGRIGYTVRMKERETASGCGFPNYFYFISGLS